MIEYDNFIAAIKANPLDNSVRRVFADWLTENGQSEWGEFINVQIDLSEISIFRHKGHFNHSVHAKWCSEPSCECCRLLSRQEELLRAVRDSMLGGFSFGFRYDLPDDHTSAITASDFVYDSRVAIGGDMCLLLRRGFVEKVAGDPAGIVRHIGEIAKSNPVLEVVFFRNPDITFGPIVGGTSRNERSRTTEYRAKWSVRCEGHDDIQNIVHQVADLEVYASGDVMPHVLEESFARRDRLRTPIGYLESKFPGVTFRVREQSPAYTYMPGTQMSLMAGGQIQVGEWVGVSDGGRVVANSDNYAIGIAMNSARLGELCQVWLTVPWQVRA